VTEINLLFYSGMKGEQGNHGPIGKIGEPGPPGAVGLVGPKGNVFQSNNNINTFSIIFG